MSVVAGLRVKRAPRIKNVTRDERAHAIRARASLR
jgi:hypothetical protein